MNPDQAIVLVSDLLRTTLLVAGPFLLVSLLAGVLVGIAQTATQVNEASISFLVKAVAVVAVGVALGSHLAAFALDYTRASLTAIGDIVR